MSKKIVLGFFILSLVLFGAGCGKQAAVPEEVKSQAVTVGKVEKGSLANILTISGKISPKESAKVVPKTPGKVRRINVQVGQTVKAGQILMELENNDILANIQAAQAGIAAAQANLEGAKIRLADAERILNQKKSLLDAGAIPQNEYDMAKKDYDLAVTAANPASVNQAQATLRLRQVELENSVIRSPINGIVASKSVNVGELASNGTPAFEVVNLVSVEVEASLTESDINRIKQNMDVGVKVSAVSETPLIGKVTKVSPKADDKTKTYPFWVTMDNSNQLLKPGMFAEIQLETERKDGVIIAPLEAIVERNGYKVVYVNEGGKAKERKVTLGITDGKKAEILEGLQEGESLILTGFQTLADGMDVTVPDQTAAPGVPQ